MVNNAFVMAPEGAQDRAMIAQCDGRVLAAMPVSAVMLLTLRRRIYVLSHSAPVQIRGIRYNRLKNQ